MRDVLALTAGGFFSFGVGTALEITGLIWPDLSGCVRALVLVQAGLWGCIGVWAFVLAVVLFLRQRRLAGEAVRP